MDKETKEQFITVINEIADLRKKYNRLSDEKHEIYKKTSLLRAKHVLDIANAEDASGKRIYSNEKMREAAQIVRLSEDEEYQKLVEIIEGVTTEIDNIQIRLLTLADERLMLLLDAGVDPYGNIDF